MIMQVGATVQDTRLQNDLARLIQPLCLNRVVFFQGTFCAPVPVKSQEVPKYIMFESVFKQQWMMSRHFTQQASVRR